MTSAWSFTDSTGTVATRDIEGGGTESMLVSALPPGSEVKEYTPQPEPVPQQITRAQGKAALIMQGHWQEVQDYVSAIQDQTQRALADVALNDTQAWERSSPFLNAAAAGLGMTDEQLDALFIQAARIAL